MKKQNRKITEVKDLHLSMFPEVSDQILSSERDKKIFFDALMNPLKPNENLRNAFRLHQEFIKNSR
jgi:hypothetical protein